ILTTLALGVLHHLRNRRLAHINDGAAIQVLRRDLRIHVRFPPRLPFPRRFRRGLPTADRPALVEARRSPARSAGLLGRAGDSAPAGWDKRFVVAASGASSFDGRPKELRGDRFGSSPTITVRNSSSALSATTGDPSVIDEQAEAEHIHAGSSLDNPERTSRCTLSRPLCPVRRITRNRRPCRGCQGYSITAKCDRYAECRPTRCMGLDPFAKLFVFGPRAREDGDEAAAGSID